MGFGCPGTRTTISVRFSRIVPPHIVAGINLNLPVIGTLLRTGGAFFIRRSIRGSALYSAVLGEYVAQLVSGGYSLEYFIEGGRSRTGRLLQPKGGMLAMTYALDNRPELESLVLCGSPASMPRWIRECGELLSQLPDREREEIERHRLCGRASA